ncbi:MAG: hypothetical protein R3Y51_06830 [Rikenellaceae bacterium]
MIKELSDEHLIQLSSYNANFSQSGCPLHRSDSQISNQIAENIDYELIQDAYNCWISLEKTRNERKRNLKYKNGDQWSDYILDPESNGRIIREDQLLMRNGRTPMKHNFIQQFVRNLTGHLLSNPSQSVVHARSKKDSNLGEMLTNALQYSLQLNKIDKINITMLEELLLSGIVCTKVHYSYFTKQKMCDVKVDLVNINRFFFNTDIEDPRLDDIKLLGEFHDYTYSELISNFASSLEDEAKLSKIFRIQKDSISSLYGMSTDKINSSSFFNICDNKCRIYEVWQKKGRWVNFIHDTADGSETVTPLSELEIAEINNNRIQKAENLGIKSENVPLVKFHQKFEQFWHVKFLTATGAVIKERETPYAHKEHPYVITTMPILDGEFKGFISDLVDIQHYINKLLVTQDFIIGTSAKGVLMIPESSIPDGYSVQDFAEEYVKVDGIIVYKPSSTGEKPYQVARDSTNAGIWQMLSTQIELLKDISGISSAQLGQKTSNTTPSSLYAQQTVNSLINHKSLFNTVTSGENERNEKIVKVIMQYYNEPRQICFGLDNGNNKNSLYDPTAVKNIETFNLVSTQSIDTPVYREMYDDILMNMLERNHIPIDIFLDNCSLPFAEKILMQLKNRGAK